MNDSTFSSTQAANLTALAGVIVLVLGRFGVTIASEDVITVLAASIAIFGVCRSYYLRYKRGDLTFGGFRR